MIKTTGDIIKLVYNKPYNHLFINTDGQILFFWWNINFWQFIHLDIIINELIQELNEKEKKEEKPIRNTVENKWKKENLY